MGVDSSTQSCKVVIVDAASGAIVREGRASHPDGTSVDPEVWWSALQEAIAAYRENICRGVLATDLTCAPLEGEGREWNINGVQARLFVVRA